MNFISEELENYCEEYSVSDDMILKRLIDSTMKNEDNFKLTYVYTLSPDKGLRSKLACSLFLLPSETHHLFALHRESNFLQVSADPPARARKYSSPQ